ncbi:MAG TPA: plastocyanin/azurin family copper-binding protein [Candidatus Bathyarchaeia archaeon]|nr:plastocyanin/azurin family copper-binding protein [Candidatus Bathyarchaeia archaeon]
MTQTTPPPTTTAPKPRSRTVLYAIIIIILVVVGVGVYYLTLPAGKTANIVVNDDGSCPVNDAACNYVPSLYNATLNTPVTWKNNGRIGHTVTSCDSANTPSAQACPTMNAAGLDTFNQNIGSGVTVSQTLTKAGTYYYYCAIHPTMHGTIGAR